MSSSSFLLHLPPTAEQQVKISASRLWREQNEERRSAHENYAEELRDGKEETADECSHEL